MLPIIIYVNKIHLRGSISEKTKSVGELHNFKLKIEIVINYLFNFLNIIYYSFIYYIIYFRVYLDEQAKRKGERQQ